MATAKSTTPDLDADIKTARSALRSAGVPGTFVDAIGTRALRSGRRTTGEFRSNRNPRWTLDPRDPQYGSERDCKLVLLKLYATLLEFEGAPAVTNEAKAMFEKYLGRPLDKDSFRDELTLEKLSYAEIEAEALDPKPGISGFHIGHRDASIHPKHTPNNVEWRTERSNLIQGTMTLAEARTKFVELIARYFELGEVTITPDR